MGVLDKGEGWGENVKEGNVCNALLLIRVFFHGTSFHWLLLLTTHLA